jgi:hypothetical protein
MGHALLSPSGWATWSTCPGSVKAQAGLPDSSSTFADEGTAAHWVLEQVLTDLYVLGEADVPASRYVGREVNVADDGQEPRYVTVGREMADHIQTVVDYVQQRVAALSVAGPVEVFAERRVNPALYLDHNDSPGTADVTLLNSHEVEIIDLKYGQGVGVEVHHDEEGPNGQLMLYALGVAAEHRHLGGAGRTYRITVAQPRYHHPDGPVRSWAFDGEGLYQFAERAKAAAVRTQTEPETRVASEHGCRWCKARFGAPALGVTPCREYSEWTFAQFAGPNDFSAANFLDDLQALTQKVDKKAGTTSLTEEEIVNLLDSADLIRGLLSAVEGWASQALETGAAGELLRDRYKLIEGRTQRRWAFDEDSVANALKKIRWKDEVSGKTTGLGKKDLYQERLASPTQIEKRLNGIRKGLTATHWNAFRALIDRPRGSAKLVPASDPGQDISGSRDPQVMFAGVEQAAATTTPSSSLDDLL